MVRFMEGLFPSLEVPCFYGIIIPEFKLVFKVKHNFSGICDVLSGTVFGVSQLVL